MARVSAHPAAASLLLLCLQGSHWSLAAVEWLRGLRGVVASVVMSMVVCVVPGQP